MGSNRGNVKNISMHSVLKLLIKGNSGNTGIKPNKINTFFQEFFFYRRHQKPSNSFFLMVFQNRNSSNLVAVLVRKIRMWSAVCRKHADQKIFFKGAQVKGVWVKIIFENTTGNRSSFSEDRMPNFMGFFRIN